MATKTEAKYEMKWWQKVMLVGIFIVGGLLFWIGKFWISNASSSAFQNRNLTVKQAKKAYMGNFQVKNEKAAR